MKLNNKGLSLVELIVVIAIMTVLSGIAYIGVGSIFNSQVTQCTENMENLINKVRVSTLGRNGVTLRFYQDTDGSYYAETKVTKGYGSSATVETTVDKVGKAGIIVKYTNDTSITQHNQPGVLTLSSLDSNQIDVQFNRSSGEALPNCVSKIWIIRNSKESTITIYKETGKVVVD